MNPRWTTFLRIVVGIFFLSQGLNKTTWFSSSEFLRMSLDRYAFEAHRVTQWYLTSVAVPGVETWARLIPMGEMAIGVALILGLLTLPTLIVSSLLVINYQIATGTLFSPAFFFSPYALLLLSTILILMFSKAGDRFSLDKFIFKKGSKR